MKTQEQRSGKATVQGIKTRQCNRLASSLEALVQSTCWVCTEFPTEAFSHHIAEREGPQPHTLETESYTWSTWEHSQRDYTAEAYIREKKQVLTVLKFGKSPTAELLSTGKDINGLMSSEGCIIRVGVRTRAGRVVAWHALPAKDKAKQTQPLAHILSRPGTLSQPKAAEL